MKKRGRFASVLVCLFFLLGCNGTPTSPSLDWIPESKPMTDSSTPTLHPLEWLPETKPMTDSSTSTSHPSEWLPEATPTAVVSATPTPQPLEQLPEHEKKNEVESDSDSDDIAGNNQNDEEKDDDDPDMVIQDSNSVSEDIKLYTPEELYAAMENTNGRELADMLWENQKGSGLYECSSEKLKEKNMLTFYVSSSEGNDSNTGKSPDKPKKTLEAFNGVSNVNVLLKCGDTFSMTDTFRVGNNVILASYGEGPRPIMDFYQPLNVSWEAVSGCSNVWSADLKHIMGLYNGTTNKSDCNIGHLLINGEHNWKRLVKADDETYSYPEHLAVLMDGSFAVDWTDATLYLYSAKNPNQMDISYALPQHGLTVQNITQSEVLGIEIQGAGFHGISISQVSDITISNCYIHHIGGGLLRDRGPRYGNAVELWESGTGLTVAYNIAEWIYDTCYTNQGNAVDMVQQDLVFAKNLGRYSFWGIETWGDGGSVNEFKNIVYEDNVLMYACDVTNENVAVYANEREQTMDDKGEYYSQYPAYMTYRGHASSYPYNQMSLLNAANAKNKESLEIRGNIFWGTNRLLTLLKLADDGQIRFILQDNMFYAKVPLEACVFRYTDVNNQRIFIKELDEKTNLPLIQTIGEESKDIQEKADVMLMEKLYLLATGEKWSLAEKTEKE